MFWDFQLLITPSAFNYKNPWKSTCAPPSWITDRIEFLHLKHKMRLKVWFFRKKEKKRPHLTHIYRTYVRTFEHEDGERRGSTTSWNCLARNSNVDHKRQTWPLEPGHMTPRTLRSHVFTNKHKSKTLSNFLWDRFPLNMRWTFQS